MKLSDREYQKTEKTLSVAYREKDSADMAGLCDEMWRVRTMSRIRRVGLLNAKTGFFEQSEYVMWRFAPVACAIIILLSVILYNIGVVPEYEIAKLYMDDPVGYTIVQTFGM